MQRRFGILWRYSTVFIVAACASSAPSTAKPTPERDQPPRMVARGASPQWRIPSSSASRSAINVTVEVMIDTTGRPDMGTFRVTGSGASENRDVLAAWIQQAIFQPAQRGGQPVPGLFSQKLQVRLERSRTR